MRMGLPSALVETLLCIRYRHIRHCDSRWGWVQDMHILLAFFFGGNTTLYTISSLLYTYKFGTRLS